MGTSVKNGRKSKEEEKDHKITRGIRKKASLANIVGIGKSGTKSNAVALKKRIQKGEEWDNAFHCAGEATFCD